MKTMLYAGAATLLMMPTFASAGIIAAYEPPGYSPVDIDEGNDMGPALLLIGLLGIVVASGSGVFATRKATTMEPLEPLDE